MARFLGRGRSGGPRLRRWLGLLCVGGLLVATAACKDPQPEAPAPPPPEPAAAADASAAATPAAPAAIAQAPALEPATVEVLAAGAGFGAAPPAAAAGGLKVQWILPDAEVAPHAVGSIGFDRPMVPLTQVDDDAKVDWLEIEPAVPLRLRWLDPQTLSVAPRSGWPTASAFTLRVRAGAKALDGTALEAAVATTFRTPALAIAGHWPVGGPTRTGTGVAVLFSLPVTKAAAERALRVSADGALPAVTVDVPSDEASLQRALDAASLAIGQDLKPIVGHVAVLRFAAPLARDLKVTASVQAGMMPATGTRGLADATTWSFRTHGDFVASQLGCDGRCDPEEWRPIHVDFSNPLPEETPDASYQQYFEIKPSIGKISVTCWSSRCAIGGRLKPDTEYEVRLKPGMVDLFGQKLAAGLSAKVTMGPLSPSLELVTEGSILERHQAPWQLAYRMRNENAELRLARIDVAAWLKLRSLPSWGGPTTPRLPGAQVVRPLRNDVPNVTKLFAIDVGKELGLEGPALVHAEVLGTMRGNRRPRAERLVQVTDMHLHVRSWRAGLLVWVTSLSTGRPVPGVALQVLGPKGEELSTATTGDDGTAEVRSTVGEPILVARKGDDLALMELGWKYRERGDWQSEERLRSVVFFEKELFKPGETAHLRGLLRRVDGDALELPQGAVAVVRLSDPEGEEVSNQTFTLSANGGFAAELKLPKEARYGTWSASVHYTDAGRELDDSASFRIAVYEPQRTAASVQVDRGHLLPGDEAKASVEASWLSGGPMRDGKVTLRAWGERELWRPEGWAGFDFDNDDGADRDGASHGDKPLTTLEHTSSGVLDANGTWSGQIPAGAVVSHSQRVLVEATVADPSGRELTRQASLWLQPSERIVGHRPSTVVVQAGGPLLVDVVAVDLAGKADKEAKVATRLLSHRYKTIRSERVGGTWEWETSVEESEVAVCASEPAPDAGEGVRRCTFTAPSPGTFVIESTVQDAKGRARRSRSYVWASGEGEVNWGGDDEQSPMIVADKAHYRVGDTAHLLVKNPAPGAIALVTEDRGRVRRRRMVQLDRGAATIDVAIDSAAQPNLFVSVVVFRGRQRADAPARLDLGAPVLKVGTIELDVDVQEHKLQVAIDAPKAQLRPGQTVELSARVLDAAGKPVEAEVTLAVVDEGVLALTSMATPNPFAPFYAHHPHGVTDYALSGELVRKRVSEEKGDMGGDGGDSAPMVRGDFRDLAYYAPALQADADGRVKAKVKLPDNLTSWRIMAIAIHGARAFGSADEHVRVGKPLMLMPRLPRYAQPGDLVEASITVRHGGDPTSATAIAGDVTLQVEGDAVALQAKPTQSFRLEAGGATELRFALRANKLGKVKITARGKAGSEADAVEGGFEVIEQRPIETSAMLGRLDDGNEVKQTLLRPEGSLDVGGLQVDVASSGVAGMRASLEPLLDYPFGCLEQTSSRLLALLYVRRLQADYKLFADLDGASIERRIHEALERIDLLGQRTGDHGYAMWPTGDDASPVGSAWVAVVLAQAERLGHKVPAAKLTKLKGYLSQQLSNASARKQLGPDGRARVVHALARLGAAPDAELGELIGQRAKLSRSSRLELALAAAHSSRDLRKGQALEMANEEAGHLQVDAAAAHLPNEADLWWGSAKRDEAMLLELLVRVRPSHPLLDRLGRGAVARRADRWASTQEHAWSLLGVQAWVEAVEQAAPDFAVQAKLGAEAFGRAEFRGRSAAASSFFVPQTRLTAASPVDVLLARDGQGPLYWSMRYAYVQPAVADAARNAGLLVSRRVVAMDGRVDPEWLDRGGFAAVTVEVWSGLQRRDAAIVDFLPAGLEAVDFELDGQPEIVRRKLAALDKGADPDGDDGDLDGGWSPWATSVAHREMTPQQVRFFVDTLPSGRSVFRYVVRARTRGVSRWQGSNAQLMYEPEVFGRARTLLIEVR